MSPQLPNTSSQSSGVISLSDGSVCYSADASNPSILEVWSPVPAGNSSSSNGVACTSLSTPPAGRTAPSEASQRTIVVQSSTSALSPISSITPRQSQGSTVCAKFNQSSPVAPWSLTTTSPNHIIDLRTPSRSSASSANPPWTPSPTRSARRVIDFRRPLSPLISIPFSRAASASSTSSLESEGEDPITDEKTMKVHATTADYEFESPSTVVGREIWLPEPWPADVEVLRDQFNPSKWKFPSCNIGVRGGADCGCEVRCNTDFCLNARESRFCDPRNCVFVGDCGNALVESKLLLLARSSRTGLRGLVATGFIPAGEVIGQYLGHMQLFGPPCRNGPYNDGYRMHLKTRSTGGKYIGIDAKDCGGQLRFMNHACDPVAIFHEVQTGTTLTVVAVTVRDIFAGEQVTVSYGSALWFICKCGWTGCQHRDFQANSTP